MQFLQALNFKFFVFTAIIDSCKTSKSIISIWNIHSDFTNIFVLNLSISHLEYIDITNDSIDGVNNQLLSYSYI